MKTLILYESKYGATKKCMQYVANKLDDVTMSTIQSWNQKIHDYDQVIIGSPTYIGQINKHVKGFLQSHKEELLQRALIVSICGMNDKEFDTMLEANMDQEIRQHATIIPVGGIFNFEKMKFLDRLIVKKVVKVYETTDQINYKQLDSVIKKATL